MLAGHVDGDHAVTDGAARVRAERREQDLLDGQAEPVSGPVEFLGQFARRRRRQSSPVPAMTGHCRDVVIDHVQGCCRQTRRRIHGPLPSSAMYGATMQLTVQRMSQKWETTPKTVTAVSIKAAISFAVALPKPGDCVYGVSVPRTDENGRQLKALLDYLLDGESTPRTSTTRSAFPAAPITGASRKPTTRTPRSAASGRPFELSYPDLQIRFGLMSRQEVWNYVESDAVHRGAPPRRPRTRHRRRARRSCLS